MEDEPHEIWFYSRDGEKRGPVSFTHLQAKAKDASLNPRLDMVWTKGMDEWKLAGEIDGLFKRRPALEPPEIPTPALAVDPAPAPDFYQPPPEESIAEQMAKQTDWPGARRRSYLIAICVFPILWGLGTAAGTEFLTTQFGPQIMRFAMPPLALVPLLVIIYFAVKRLANLGMSPLWIFGNFIPILNIWVGYRCFACPAGYAYHKKLDVAGVILTIIWCIFVVAVVGAIAALYGDVGTPEIQRQLRETLRNVTAPAS